MQIELIGCSGAGKSTLARNIVRSCQEQGIDIALGDEFVLKQARLDWIKSRGVRALVVNVAALFACLVNWRHNLRFYRFAARSVIRLPISRVDKVYVLRNALKKLGIGEITRAGSADHQIILLDEGVLHVAHNLFVHVSADPKRDAIAAFVKLIPKPNVVVYLRQPESILIERIMERGHKRIGDRSYDNVFRFVKRAAATFDELVEDPTVASRLLVVHGEQDVLMVADDQDDPMMGLALKIIESGLARDATDTSQEIMLAPGPYTVHTSSGLLSDEEFDSGIDRLNR